MTDRLLHAGRMTMGEKGVVKDNELKQIKEHVESIKYGSVNIIIQDGKIVQIDKNEKIRL